MSEANKNDDNLDKEENYETAKLSYEVVASYDVPAWYKKHVWLWSAVLAYIFILYMAAPQNVGFAAVTFGIYIVILDLAAIWVRKHWPL